MKIPESTKLSLQGKLVARQRERWPQLQDVRVRFRGNLAYVDGVLSDGDLLPLCRLRYAGSATYFGFAVYLASRDGYEDSFLPNGAFEATPADALDCACGLYLGDPGLPFPVRHPSRRPRSPPGGLTLEVDATGDRQASRPRRDADRNPGGR